MAQLLRARLTAKTIRRGEFYGHCQTLQYILNGIALMKPCVRTKTKLQFPKQVLSW